MTATPPMTEAFRIAKASPVEPEWDRLYAHERHLLWMMEQDAKCAANYGRHADATHIRDRIEFYRRQYTSGRPA